MLKLKNISLNINSKNILNDINIDINNNELIVITGPNGSGKTSLAKLIMGIYKPSKGSIFYNDEDITTYGIDERSREGISYSFQIPVNFKQLTVKRLLSIASNKYLNEDDIKGILSNVGLCAEEYENRTLSNTLSGGEAKRIEIASVLAKKSSLIIFDEPESGIDLWSFNNLMNIFDDLKNKTDKTIIIISHNPKIIEMADKIIIMENGKVKYFGKDKDLNVEKCKCNKCKEALCER